MFWIPVPASLPLVQVKVIELDVIVPGVITLGAVGSVISGVALLDEYIMMSSQ